MTAGPDSWMKPMSHRGPTRSPEPWAPGSCASAETTPQCVCWTEAPDVEGTELDWLEFPPVHATSDERTATDRNSRTPTRITPTRQTRETSVRPRETPDPD